MGGQINIGVSASTFQSGPKNFSNGTLGENFSTIGTNINYNKIPHWTVYTGLGMTVPDKTDIENIDKEISYSFIGDIKSSHKYYDGEYFSISADSRSRFNLNKSSKTLALRVAPVSINVPLDDKTSIYVVPYILEKVDLEKGISQQSLKDNLRAGVYLGGKRKFNISGTDVTIFFEGQGYNIVKNVKDATAGKPFDKTTVSANAGLSFSVFGK